MYMYANNPNEIAITARKHPQTDQKVEHWTGKLNVSENMSMIFQEPAVVESTGTNFYVIA